MQRDIVDCPTCGRHVDYKYLRSDNPRDEHGHDLGKWVHCDNITESHVYLRNKKSEVKCPYCASTGFVEMKSKEKVKCIHSTDAGLVCTTRPYSWLEEGPPCFMNHISKTRMEEPSKIS